MRRRRGEIGERQGAVRAGWASCGPPDGTCQTGGLPCRGANRNQAASSSAPSISSLTSASSSTRRIVAISQASATSGIKRYQNVAGDLAHGLARNANPWKRHLAQKLPRRWASLIEFPAIAEPWREPP